MKPLKKLYINQIFKLETDLANWLLRRDDTILPLLKEFAEIFVSVVIRMPVKPSKEEFDVYIRKLVKHSFGCIKGVCGSQDISEQKSGIVFRYLIKSELKLLESLHYKIVKTQKELLDFSLVYLNTLVDCVNSEQQINMEGLLELAKNLIKKRGKVRVLEKSKELSQNRVKPVPIPIQHILSHDRWLAEFFSRRKQNKFKGAVGEYKPFLMSLQLLSVIDQNEELCEYLGIFPNCQPKKPELDPLKEMLNLLKFQLFASKKFEKNLNSLVWEKSLLGAREFISLLKQLWDLELMSIVLDNFVFEDFLLEEELHLDFFCREKISAIAETLTKKEPRLASAPDGWNKLLLVLISEHLRNSKFWAPLREVSVVLNNFIHLRALESLQKQVFFESEGFEVQFIPTGYKTRVWFNWDFREKKANYELVPRRVYYGKLYIRKGSVSKAETNKWEQKPGLFDFVAVYFQLLQYSLIANMRAKTKSMTGPTERGFMIETDRNHNTHRDNLLRCNACYRESLAQLLDLHQRNMAGLHKQYQSVDYCNENETGSNETGSTFNKLSEEALSLYNSVTEKTVQINRRLTRWVVLDETTSETDFKRKIVWFNDPLLIPPAGFLRLARRIQKPFCGSD